MTKYDYADTIWLQIDQAIEVVLPTAHRLERASKAEDVGGIDAIYNIGGKAILQLRCRGLERNRPAYAPDVDVTFRSTEPPMIAKGTYAPLMVFLWFHDERLTCGKLVDVYRLHQRATPPLADRDLEDNGDGTAWLRVTVPELFEYRALLRMGETRCWVNAFHDSQRRVVNIVGNTGAYR